MFGGIQMFLGVASCSWKIFFPLSFQELNIDSSLFAGVDLLIAVGSIIMVLGFLGCCGAIKESRCMLLLVGKKNIWLPLTGHSYVWWIRSLQVASNADGELFFQPNAWLWSCVFITYLVLEPLLNSSAEKMMGGLINRKTGSREPRACHELFFHTTITKVPSTSPPPLPIPFNFINSQLLPLLVLLECPPCPPAQRLSPTHCPSWHCSGVHLVLFTSRAHSVSSTPFSRRRRRNNWSGSDWNFSSFYPHGFSSTWKLDIHLEEIISSWSKVL